MGATCMTTEESSSFLKKRTKRLLSTAGGAKLADLNRPLAAFCKSFLLLFFKKEESSFLVVRH
jgi:hypothetical protein